MDFRCARRVRLAPLALRRDGLDGIVDLRFAVPHTAEPALLELDKVLLVSVRAGRARPPPRRVTRTWR